MSAYTRLLAVTVGVVAASAVGVAPAQAAGTYAGSWTAIDHDGSHMTLTIQGTGPRYAVREVDDSATSACGGSPATVNGSGSVDGDWLVVHATLACTPGGNVLRFRVEIAFSYDAGSGTLVDNEGVVWSRA
jgi:hypothetical protein